MCKKEKEKEINHNWDDILEQIKSKNNIKSKLIKENNTDDSKSIITSSTLSTAHSLYSINTDYSAITADIFLNHTNHSQQRSKERQIDDDLIRKCLK